jgi:hypothetical protein
MTVRILPNAKKKIRGEQRADVPVSYRRNIGRSRAFAVRGSANVPHRHGNAAVPPSCRSHSRHANF